ncbi:hypothetical protein AYR62_05620 [Secundilactobacillus paracollinoides]|uniref:HTH merR-type domain-containing protein n=1 Tax=Secundilactobacillus paracollinoides TaxID=240427 RepID=A0A1B2J0P4_9LACO|nr:MerR family transcriptional regulator [Secundilactobacillus paracollinoides]ANZ61935.1 hypothetical protein AYR61_11630 [Secundilactobacillus paracollinoides]ANZ63621.1 hypothetical protein AYR62_05620 [Secundilactobacillus paracollinoides]ANZ67881.1 hypothetical protein AYR63_12525 [Secundilactobacillus paracollinoides]
MRISEVSQQFNISIQTLYYYEREGIIPPIQKNKSGNRDYTSDDLKWIHYIRSLRRAHVSLEQIRRYVAMVQVGQSTRAERLALLKNQRKELERQISGLQDSLSWITHKIDYFDTYKQDLEGVVSVNQKKPCV